MTILPNLTPCFTLQLSSMKLTRLLRDAHISLQRVDTTSSLLSIARCSVRKPRSDEARSSASKKWGTCVVLRLSCVRPAEVDKPLLRTLMCENAPVTFTLGCGPCMSMVDKGSYTLCVELEGNTEVAWTDDIIYGGRRAVCEVDHAL
jgi:hypothetical protein